MQKSRFLCSKFVDFGLTQKYILQASVEQVFSMQTETFYLSLTVYTPKNLSILVFLEFICRYLI